MKLGAAIPSPGGFPEAPGPGVRARMAEDAGAQSLWVNDHLVQVENSTSRYPFSPDGKPTWSPDLPHWESLTTLAFMAAATSTATIGTAVLILPQRQIVELAKTTATLDVLSGGRLVLGCGIGWLAEEMEACGWDFRTRGKRANELLTALRECWSGRPAALAGQHVTLPEGLVFEPRPAQRPGPPILVGGMSRAGLRRAAHLADGWLAIAITDTLDWHAVETGVAAVREERAAGPRADEPFRLAMHLHSAPEEAADIPELALRFAALGFDEVIIDPPWGDADAAQANIGAVREALDTVPVA